MAYNIFYTVICAIAVTLCFKGVTSENDDWSFPEDFSLGTATSAYQIEGAWNVSDKGESIWDRFSHEIPSRIDNGENGDVACDSYHKYKEDVQLVKELGLKHYRFSLSWSRILPTGYANVVSKDGVAYYNNLIDELNKNNITPYVTLYHWDLPQVFQDMGGWTNEVMVDLFGDYARVVYREFGGKVKMFATMNEPSVFCHNGYSIGETAPGLRGGRSTEYLCSHNVLKAHARAYHIYNDEFRSHQKGQVGIVLNCRFFYPKNPQDTQSVDVAFNFDCGRYAHPIFSRNGDYPDIVKERVAQNSEYEGLRRSRLPTFSDEWISYIRGSSDYFGLNHYSSKIVEPQTQKPNNTLHVNDTGILSTDGLQWTSTPASFIRIVPQGFRDLLRRVKKEYGDVPIHIAENGVADTGTLNDNQRLEYISLYMKAMLTAMKKYNVNIKAYTIWSLLDNYEWNHGYSLKFGLYQVDFKDPSRPRIPKKSVSWVKEVTRTRKVQPIEKCL